MSLPPVRFWPYCNGLPAWVQGKCAFLRGRLACFWAGEGEGVGIGPRRWNGRERGPPGRGPISLEKWGKEHSGLCPETPPGKRVSFPRTLFLQAGVEAAIFFYRPTWPAASKTNASWPAHQLGRAGEVIHRREEKTGTRTVTFCLLPKGTCPRPQPAQPVGGPLRAFRCEGRRPGIL